MSKEESSLEEELTFSPGSVWEKADDETTQEMMNFSEGYKNFISDAKTEREIISYAVDLIEEKGFKRIDEYEELVPGDRLYIVNRNKCLLMGVVGKNDIEDGCNIVASHIDSPRLDLKARPLYEDKDAHLALLKTHYYGGIKKYQWVNTPLAIHGRIVKEDGECIDVLIGEEEDDPIFVVSDLLPHLSKKKQGDRKMKDVIKGEELNVLIGGKPIDDDEIEEKIKINILRLLRDEYDITEEDFTSAELEIVPAGSARDVGFDRSMIGGYGHDDRVCAYTSLMAGLRLEKPEKTSLVVLFDKEEIGSQGNTGAASKFLESSMSRILSKIKDGHTIDQIREMIDNSKAISGDVGAGLNPPFKSVHELRNASRLSHGIVLTKFTGAGGKFSANDAHAEYVAFIRKIFNENDILWQPSEIGKVDEGGGGTVARFIANMNIDVIDAGPAVLGMHSPLEIASKADIFHTYRAYKVFLESD